MSTEPTTGGPTVDEVAAAFKLLEERFPARPDTVGAKVEAVANAAHVLTLPPEKRATLGRVKPANTEEIRAALVFVPIWQSEVDSAIRALLVAARLPENPDDPNSRARLTWQEIGLLLGFPTTSAKQRARQLAARLGALTTTEQGD